VWNDSQFYFNQQNPKRVYYLSMEFLMGRSLLNALFNLNVKDKYTEALHELGYSLEELQEQVRASTILTCMVLHNAESACQHRPFQLVQHMHQQRHVCRNVMLHLAMADLADWQHVFSIPWLLSISRPGVMAYGISTACFGRTSKTAFSTNNRTTGCFSATLGKSND
jgi:hypothetical protein